MSSPYFLPATSVTKNLLKINDCEETRNYLSLSYIIDKTYAIREYMKNSNFQMPEHIVSSRLGNILVLKHNVNDKNPPPPQQQNNY